MGPGFRRDAGRSSSIIWTKSTGSERGGQQRVDLAAVEDATRSRKSPAAFGAHHAVDIAPRREQHHPAILHRAHDEEIGGNIERARILALDADARDQMAIALRL